MPSKKIQSTEITDKEQKSEPKEIEDTSALKNTTPINPGSAAENEKSMESKIEDVKVEDKRSDYERRDDRRYNRWNSYDRRGGYDRRYSRWDDRRGDYYRGYDYRDDRRYGRRDMRREYDDRRRDFYDRRGYLRRDDRREDFPRNNSDPSNGLIVFGLGSEMTSEQFKDILSNHIKFKFEARAIEDRDSRRCKGFGFINFDTVDEAKEARKILEELGSLQNNEPLRCDFSRGDRRDMRR